MFRNLKVKAIQVLGWGSSVMTALLLVVASGCSSPGGPVATPPIKGGNAEVSSYDLLQVGDQVSIILQDIPSPPQPYEQKINEDGFITLQFNVRIHAAGKTVSELQDAIIEAYVPEYYHRMSVNIQTELQYFTVMGDVRAPGRQSHIGKPTLLTAIAGAGGFTDFANRKKVFVTRGSNGEIIEVDCTEAARKPTLDVPIYAGDRIEVKRRIL